MVVVVVAVGFGTPAVVVVVDGVGDIGSAAGSAGEHAATAMHRTTASRRISPL